MSAQVLAQDEAIEISLPGIQCGASRSKLHSCVGEEWVLAGTWISRLFSLSVLLAALKWWCGLSFLSQEEVTRRQEESSISSSNHWQIFPEKYKYLGLLQQSRLAKPCPSFTAPFNSFDIYLSWVWQGSAVHMICLWGMHVRRHRPARIVAPPFLFPVEPLETCASQTWLLLTI